MIVNATKLDADLKAAGIPIHGCDSTDRVDFHPEATAEHRALAAQIVAAHDPVKAQADAAKAKALEAAIAAETRLLVLERLAANGVDGAAEEVAKIEAARAARGAG